MSRQPSNLLWFASTIDSAALKSQPIPSVLQKIGAFHRLNFQDVQELPEASFDTTRSNGRWSHLRDHLKIIKR